MTVVEMRDELAPDANIRHRPILLNKINDLVEVRTGLKGLEITAEGVVCMVCGRTLKLVSQKGKAQM